MNGSGYGLWALVLINSAVFILFAASFFHPRTRRDWRAMGVFSAFVVALFTELYGFPLTLYLVSGWLGGRLPALELTHNGGHLWAELVGWNGDPHLSPFHLGSYVMIIVGFWLIAAAWRVLWEAQRSHGLARTGPYAYVRHPQYAGFLLIMVGFLLQWPTIPTLVMFPVMAVVYRRLAVGEERSMLRDFGDAWVHYAAETPRFLPRPGRGGGDRSPKPRSRGPLDAAAEEGRTR